MRRRAVVIAGGALGLATLAGFGHRRSWSDGRAVQAEALGGAHPFVRATLSAAWRFGALLATLTLENLSARESALLDEHNLPIDGELTNNVFQGVGSRLRYVGEYGKRPAPSREDFVELPPNAVQAFEVDLTRWYDVPHFAALAFRYEAFHGPPDADGPMLVRSNVVEIAT